MTSNGGGKGVITLNPQINLVVQEHPQNFKFEFAVP